MYLLFVTLFSLRSQHTITLYDNYNNINVHVHVSYMNVQRQWHHISNVYFINLFTNKKTNYCNLLFFNVEIISSA